MHPIDIERALKNDYSKDARKRDLQLEAKAHVAVQKWIDEIRPPGIIARTAPGMNSANLLETTKQKEAWVW
jgi:hypothetical protein